MKRSFFVLSLIILFILSPNFSSQTQLPNNNNADFDSIIDLAKQIVVWSFVFLIVVFGIAATVMNLSRKDKNKEL